MGKLAFVDILNTEQFRQEYLSFRDMYHQIRGFVFGDGVLYTVEERGNIDDDITGDIPSKNAFLYKYEVVEKRLVKTELLVFGSDPSSRVELRYYNIDGDPFLVFVGWYGFASELYAEYNYTPLNFFRISDGAFTCLELGKDAGDYVVADVDGFNGYDFNWQEEWYLGTVDYVKITGFGTAEILKQTANDYCTFTEGLAVTKFSTQSQEYLYMQSYQNSTNEVVSFSPSPCVMACILRGSDMEMTGIDSENWLEGNITLSSEGLTVTTDEDWQRRGIAQYAGFSIVNIEGKGYVIFQKEPADVATVYVAEVLDIVYGDRVLTDESRDGGYYCNSDIVIGPKKVFYTNPDPLYNHAFAESYKLDSGNYVVVTCDKTFLVDTEFNVLDSIYTESGCVVWETTKVDNETGYPFKGGATHIPGLGLLAHGTSSNIVHYFYEENGSLKMERYPVLHNYQFSQRSSNQRSTRGFATGFGYVGGRLIMVSNPVGYGSAPAIHEIKIKK